MSETLRHNSITNFAIIFSAIVLISGCKTPQQLNGTNVSNKPTEEIISQALASEAVYESFSTKVSADIKIKGQANSIKATVRVRKDSAVWVSISPALGIEMFRLICTKDSVKYVDKLKNQFFVGDYKQLNRLTNSDLNLSAIENLIVGNLLYFNPELKFRSKVDGNEFYLATRNANKLRKAMQADKNEEVVLLTDSLSPDYVDHRRLQRYQEKNEDEELIVQQYWLDATNTKVTKTIFTDLASEVSLIAEYDDFEQVDSQLFATKILVELGNAVETAMFKLSYSKIKLNTPVEMPFTIPDKYDQVFR